MCSYFKPIILSKILLIKLDILLIKIFNKKKTHVVIFVLYCKFQTILTRMKKLLLLSYKHEDINIYLLPPRHLAYTWSSTVK